jgi:hypothetical protein
VDTAAEDAIVKMLSYAGMENGGLNSMPLWRLAELIDAVLVHYDEIYDLRPELIDQAMLDDIRGAEKYNRIFSDDVLRMMYVDERLDFAGAKRWMEAFKRFCSTVPGL